MAHNWNHDKAKSSIETRLKQVESVEILEYTRELSLQSIPTNKAYRVDGVHLYADILNIGDMLNVTGTEGEVCHKRTLRFLDLHYRAVHRIIRDCDAVRVDFHNQRLHSLIAKPYNTDPDADAKRVRHAVAMGQLIIDVLAETGDDDEHIPNAKVRIGIDTGKALAVNNGRRGGREPLFLGDPANHAAKISGGGARAGIFLSNAARLAIGLDQVEEPKKTPLTTSEVSACQAAAAIGVSKDAIVQAWREDLEANPIGAFAFSRHTPPLRSLDIAALTPGNSRRQEAVSIYADIDGFTGYVAAHISDNADDVVRVFHVIRSDLDRVLSSLFDGRRIRFIGDCVHGLLCEGTAQTSDVEETISSSVLCAAALRSSFNLCLEALRAEGISVDGLGLAIGIEYGPMTVTRLGPHGERIRCSVSRGVLESEAQQRRCNGVQTAIGLSAYSSASEAVRELFGSSRIVSHWDYNEAVESMAESGDNYAKASKAEAYALSLPAVARSAEREIRPHCNAGR